MTAGKSPVSWDSLEREIILTLRNKNGNLLYLTWSKLAVLIVLFLKSANTLKIADIDFSDKKCLIFQFDKPILRFSLDPEYLFSYIQRLKLS